MTDTFGLTCDLLSRRSVTPCDAGCQDAIADFLKEVGFASRTIARGDTVNLWVQKGSKAPLFLFAGHTDVVPEGNPADWVSDAFTPTVRDGRLYARGAADMKTSDAAFASAARRFVTDYPNHKGSIAMLLTSDEEGDGYDGTVYAVEVLKSEGIAPEWCIVGEPSCSEVLGDTIKNGRRGSLNGKLTVRGIQGHVAYPEKVLNPIHAASAVAAELASRTWGKEYPGFPMSSFQISNMNAGTGAVNVVPASCTILFNIRYNPSVTAESLIEEIEAICRAHTDKAGASFDIEWKKSAFPFATSGEALSKALGDACEKTTGMRPGFSTGGGTSDARFISRWCADVVEFGPTNESIHKVNESIPVGDVDRLAEIYYQTLVHLLAE